jgi:hypothetical protein
MVKRKLRSVVRKLDRWHNVIEKERGWVKCGGQALYDYVGGGDME